MMTNRLATAMLLGLAMIVAGSARAADVIVHPGQSIQAALALASNGDSILIQPGTYLEALDLTGHDVKLIGVGGASVTVLDATGSNTSAITMFGPGATATEIRGLTIRGGTGRQMGLDFGGGGVASAAPGLTLVECAVSHNSANGGLGGGILGIATTRLFDCTVRQNSAEFGGGAALEVEAFDSRFELNFAAQDGGGVYRGAKLLRNEFVGNAANRGGGAVTTLNSLDVLRECLFENNHAAGEGGGLLHLSSGSTNLNSLGVVQSCSFRFNSAARGGGLYMKHQPVGNVNQVTLTCLNSAFVYNTATIEGDGAYLTTPIVDNPNVAITGCTFLDDTVGGGVRYLSASIVVQAPAPFPPSLISVAYCDIAGGYPGLFNIDLDPQFVNPTVGDVHLLPTSPCRDFYTASVMTGFDMDGEPRKLGAKVDIGADEFVSDCDGDNVADWIELATGAETDCDHNQVPDICQSAADCDFDGILDYCEIHFTGTATDCNHDGIPDQCQAFSDCNGDGIPDGCQVFGIADCNHDGIPDSCQTLPDCDGDGVTDACEIDQGLALDCDHDGIPDNCQSLPDCDHDGILDSCEIANGTEKDCNGNGIPDKCDLTSGLSVDLDHNDIPDECQSTIFVPSPGISTIQAGIDAAKSGDTVLVADGVYSGTGNTNLDFEDKKIEVRSANGSARCVLDGLGTQRHFVFDSALENGNAKLRGFTLRRGRGANGGSIEIKDGAQPTIRECVFTDNVATGKGGAVEITGNTSGATFEACIFVANQAKNGGGAIHCTGFSAKFLARRCTFAANSATGLIVTGGALQVEGGADVVIADSILFANSSSLAGSQAAGLAGATFDFQRCDLAGGIAGVFLLNGATAQADAATFDLDPRFVEFANRDLHLRADSPCRDVGASPIALDFEGDALAGPPDLGADEFAPHLYSQGAKTAGAQLTIGVIATPGTAPVLWFLGGSRLAKPILTPFGAFGIAPPIVAGAPFDLGTVPSNGSITLSGIVPPVLVGTKVYGQCFLGAPTGVFTNVDPIAFE